MAVRVTFIYEPDDPDDDHPMGVSDAECDEVTEKLMRVFGAEDIEFARMASVSAPIEKTERKPKL